MASGRAQADFQPMPLPQLRLSVEDQCRLRDRSTIMARQMYAGQGSEYADAQVCMQAHAICVPARYACMPLNLWHQEFSALELVA